MDDEAHLGGWGADGDLSCIAALPLITCTRTRCWWLCGRAPPAAYISVTPLTEAFRPLIVVRSGGGGGGGQAAKDILGVDIKADSWLKAHPQPGSRELAQGLKVCARGGCPVGCSMRLCDRLAWMTRTRGGQAMLQI